MAKNDLYDKEVAARKIQQWQRESRLLGKDIAKMVGVSAPYYSDIRKGKQRGSIPVLAKIAKILGRSIEDLLLDEEPKKETIKVTELRKALRPIFKGETDEIIQGIQLWRVAPPQFKAAFKTMLEV